MRSKASEKSLEMPSASNLLSTAPKINYFCVNNANSEVWRFLKPNWLVVMISCLSQKLVILSFISFSMYFEKTGIIEMGR